MATILNIETSTNVCSVSVSINGIVKSIEESNITNAHAESITIFSESALKKAGLRFDDLSAVAVSKGPGSYTGLRIGVSTAKGFCYALNKPLISVNTLKSMASGMISLHQQDDALYCPMIDARRMEVYTAIYDAQLTEINETSAEIIDDKSFQEYLKNNTVVFAGNGADKCIEFLGKNRKAVFLDGFQTSSAHMAALADEKFKLNQFEDVAYFEPFYLKDFVAGIPRVKGLK